MRAQLADGDVCRACCAFLAALAGDDAVKARLGEAQLPELCAAVLGGHAESAPTLDACAQLVAALTTRHGPNCAAFVGAHGSDALLGALRRWPKALGLHKRGALILRNLAVRVPECVPALLEQGARRARPSRPRRRHARGLTPLPARARPAGAEPVLRGGMEKSAELHDLAKAALRDMRCDVALAQPWQGMPGEERTLERGEDAPDTFGAYMDTDEARAAMRFAGFDTSQM